MGRSVICDEKLIDVLDRNSTNGYTPGLILGQFAGQKDYVVHLPTTPKPMSQDEGSEEDADCQAYTFPNIEDIDENVLSQHARTVTRMLSGGMWIIGFYVVGPGDIFSNKNSLNKLKSVANAIHNCTKGNDHLCGKDPSNQKLILHFSSLSKKFVCKCLDMTSLSSSIRPADWKFKPNVTRWLKVESTINLSWLPPFRITNTTQTTKKKLQECLKIFQTHLDSLVYNINGQFCPGDKALLSIEKQKESEENDSEDETPFQLMFFEFSEQPAAFVAEEEKSPSVQLFGVLGSRVFIHEKSTVDDAVKAVREDLMRTLASRLEMHWQTFEESEDIKRIKCLPRRVFFTPEDSDVSFSEYLFDDEVEDDAVISITENLGLMRGITDALEDFWDTPDLEEENVRPVDDVDGSNSCPKTVAKKSLFSNTLFLIGITAAFLSLFLSIIVQLFYS